MVRVNRAHEASYLCTTTSTDMPFNPNDHGDHVFHGGKTDVYLAKVSADGERLIYGTYLGGIGSEGCDTHNLAIDKEGNAYVAVKTDSPDLPVSPGLSNRKAKKEWQAFSRWGPMVVCLRAPIWVEVRRKRSRESRWVRTGMFTRQDRPYRSTFPWRASPFSPLALRRSPSTRIVSSQ